MYLIKVIYDVLNYLLMLTFSYPSRFSPKFPSTPNMSPRTAAFSPFSNITLFNKLESSIDANVM